jgi:hypothetical protein
MGSEERMRELVLSFTKDPESLPSVSRDITDAIHAELSDVDMRGSSYSRAITSFSSGLFLNMHTPSFG